MVEGGIDFFFKNFGEFVVWGGGVCWFEIYCCWFFLVEFGGVLVVDFRFIVFFVSFGDFEEWGLGVLLFFIKDLK